MTDRARSDGARPEGARLEGARPEGARPEGARSAAAGGLTSPAELVPDAVALARRWADSADRTGPAAQRRARDRLSRLVADPAGLDLAVRFVDRVVRPEDPHVAASELATIGRTAAAGARFLSPADRGLLRLGGLLAPSLPGVVVPLARRRLRSLVGHLVVDSRGPALARHLAASRAPGLRFNLNLLGEAVHGEAEAARRAARTRALLGRPDVDHVSVKVSALVPQLNPWDAEAAVKAATERLRPLMLAAARRSPPAYVTMDMEEHRDLEVTLGTFEAVMSDPSLAGFEAGIALQAYLPDSLVVFGRLLAFSRERRRHGGARIKVRLVKGANLAAERVEAELHGWRPAPYATKAEVDASYVRLLDVALRPDVTDSLRIGVASHNLYDVALAHLLARSRGVAEAMDVEMLHGMAPGAARAVLEDVGALVLYTPVAGPREFDVAVSYLVRRLEEAAGEDNFLPALAHARAAGLDRQEERFRRSVTDLGAVGTRSRRDDGSGWVPGEQFANVPDADPSRAAVRSRALGALASSPVDPSSPVLSLTADVDRVVERAVELARPWGALPGSARAAVLRTAAQRLQERRAALWGVMAHEAGKPVVEADPEVSEAVDLAAYYAERASALDDVDGARFVGVRVTVVTPPWNFPVAIPIGSALAALAAGSAVLLKPAPQTPACAEVAAEAVRDALAEHGLPPDVLQVVRVAEDEVGRHLVSHPAVEAVVLTGSLETARRFAAWRSGRLLVAETSGKNAIVVTPSADVDLAVADLVRSAFGHAGQKCSAASLAILVGSASRSRRLRRQLVDAVSSLRVAWAEDPAAVMGPVIGEPEGKLRRALTTTEPGEVWVLEPRRLDHSGRLWSPGVKAGVRPGSFFHLTECFGPVLGVMVAADLAEAVRLQNATAYGLTGGLHSLDEDEVAYWLERVEVGNAYVNRHITGAVVRRQPFGGWKGSSVGPGAKAGGPNYVAQLGSWVPAGEPTRLAEPSPRVERLLDRLTPLLAGPEHDADLAWLRLAARSDAYAWASDLGVEHDPSGLAAESNVLRYRPCEVWVRAGQGARWAQVVRLALAAACAGSALRVSVHPRLGERLAATQGFRWRDASPYEPLVHTDDQFRDLLRAGSSLPAGARVRVVGDAGPYQEVAAAAGLSLVAGPVLASGRRELLAFVREQTVSRTRHRYGHLPAGQAQPPA